MTACVVLQSLGFLSVSKKNHQSWTAALALTDCWNQIWSTIINTLMEQIQRVGHPDCAVYCVISLYFTSCLMEVGNDGNGESLQWSEACEQADTTGLPRFSLCNLVSHHSPNTCRWCSSPSIMLIFCLFFNHWRVACVCLTSWILNVSTTSPPFISVWFQLSGLRVTLSVSGLCVSQPRFNSIFTLSVVSDTFFYVLFFRSIFFIKSFTQSTKPKYFYGK